MKHFVSTAPRGIKVIALLFLCMLLFKFSVDLSYVWLSTQDSLTYPLHFNPLKYSAGLLCCVVLFFGIRHTERKASSFLLYFVFLFQIIPITSIYALNNDSSIYYFVVCFSFFLCELVVRFIKDKPFLIRNPLLSTITNWVFAGIVISFLGIIFLKYGTPSLSALNIYSVYELRASGVFQLSKYMSYIFDWVTKALLPFMIVWMLHKKKYVAAMIFCFFMLLFYLYSGNKTLLFAVPVIIVCTLWAKRENFYQEIIITGCICFSVLVFLLIFSPYLHEIWERIYSLFGRRLLIVPANNKFKYFDYFTHHPKMGLYGIFPRWIWPIESYYENVAYSYEISAIYYGKPEMNSNTGFLAEGFLRFGHLGTLFIMLLFAFLLKKIDQFQDRMEYPLAIGLFVYPVLSLSDGYLLSSLILGPWMILILILLVTNQAKKNNRTEQKRKVTDS